MLLRSIQASHFMKYEHLEISGLQEKTFIGIFGDNESGKSTIGEVVAFALFGSAVRYSTESLTQLIRWDAEKCEVKVTFAISNNEEYTVLRYLNKKGEHEAALYKGTQSTGPLATGAKEVTREIEKITKFNFENFRYTFYLAQKEIDFIIRLKQGNTREILHTMLGFDRMGKACEVLEQEVKQLESRQEKCENEFAIHKALMKNIPADANLERSLMKQLESQKKQKNQLENDWKKNETELSQQEQLVELHNKISASLHALELSLGCEFHREKFHRVMEEISHIYAFLKEEKYTLAQKRNLQEAQGQEVKKEAELADRFRKEMQHLTNLVHGYHKEIQKRLLVPEDTKETNDQNLPSAMQSIQQSLVRLSQRRKISLGAMGLFLFLGAYTILSAFLFSQGEAWLFFPYHGQNGGSTEIVLWTTGTFFLFMSLLFLTTAHCFLKKKKKNKKKAARDSVRDR